MDDFTGAGIGEYGEHGEDVESALRRLDPLFVSLFHPDFHTKGISIRESMLRFGRVYRARYPESTLNFFVGTLNEAVTEAFQSHRELLPDMPGPSHAPVQWREGKKKLLALYLHDDDLERAPFAHLFANQVLSNELVISLLAEHYLSWAWDLTVEGSYDLLQAQMVTAGLTAVWNTVIDLPRETYPLLVAEWSMWPRVGPYSSTAMNTS